MIENHTGDHVIYPDCRATFIESMNEAIAYGTYRDIRIESPFTLLSKREVALLGKDLGVRFEDTYSCYNGRERHCGKCGTCVERNEALNSFDPTEYER